VKAFEGQGDDYKIEDPKRDRGGGQARPDPLSQMGGASKLGEAGVAVSGMQKKAAKIRKEPTGSASKSLGKVEDGCCSRRFGGGNISIPSKRKGAKKKKSGETGSLLTHTPYECYQ